MKKYTAKEFVIFSLIIVIIFVTFAGGVIYLKNTQNTTLADQTTSPPLTTPTVIFTASSSVTSTPSLVETSTPTVPNSTTLITMASASTSITKTKISKITTPPKAATSSAQMMAPVLPSSTTTKIVPAPNINLLVLPYSRGDASINFISGDGWVGTWGYASQDNGLLTVGANKSTTGGEVRLQGSSGWSDLTLQTSVNWVRGETFGLIARYIDDNNYVTCEFDEYTFGKLHISLIQHLNGSTFDLAGGDVVDYYQVGGPSTIAEIQVQGDQGACGFNGSYISTVFANTILTPPLHGSIGFTTWDPQTNNSEIIVKQIGVIPGTYDLGTNINTTLQSN